MASGSIPWAAANLARTSRACHSASRLPRVPMRKNAAPNPAPAPAWDCAMRPRNATQSAPGSGVVLSTACKNANRLHRSVGWVEWQNRTHVRVTPRNPSPEARFRRSPTHHTSGRDMIRTSKSPHERMIPIGQIGTRSCAKIMHDPEKACPREGGRRLFRTISYVISKTSVKYFRFDLNKKTRPCLRAFPVSRRKFPVFSGTGNCELMPNVLMSLHNQERGGLNRRDFCKFPVKFPAS
jgi:hypothetical protein